MSLYFLLGLSQLQSEVAPVWLLEDFVDVLVQRCFQSIKREACDVRPAHTIAIDELHYRLLEAPNVVAFVRDRGDKGRLDHVTEKTREGAVLDLKFRLEAA